MAASGRKGRRERRGKGRREGKEEEERGEAGRKEGRLEGRQSKMAHVDFDTHPSWFHTVQSNQE